MYNGQVVSTELMFNYPKGRGFGCEYRLEKIYIYIYIYIYIILGGEMNLETENKRKWDSREESH